MIFKEKQNFYFVVKGEYFNQNSQESPYFLLTILTI
jgi:hypothetical protein